MLLIVLLLLIAIHSSTQDLCGSSGGIDMNPPSGVHFLELVMVERYAVAVRLNGMLAGYAFLIDTGYDIYNVEIPKYSYIVPLQSDGRIYTTKHQYWRNRFVQ